MVAITIGSAPSVLGCDTTQDAVGLSDACYCLFEPAVRFGRPCNVSHESHSGTIFVNAVRSVASLDRSSSDRVGPPLQSRNCQNVQRAGEAAGHKRTRSRADLRHRPRHPMPPRSVPWHGTRRLIYRPSLIPASASILCETPRCLRFAHNGVAPTRRRHVADAPNVLPPRRTRFHSNAGIRQPRHSPGRVRLQPRQLGPAEVVQCESPSFAHFRLLLPATVPRQERRECRTFHHLLI
jgi:hypothetical protein